MDDQMSEKGFTSEDYFNAIAENVVKFISKRSEEDIDKIRKIFGYRKPEKKEELSIEEISLDA